MTKEIVSERIWLFAGGVMYALFKEAVEPSGDDRADAWADPVLSKGRETR